MASKLQIITILNEIFTEIWNGQDKQIFLIQKSILSERC